ncbi:unnamed protein product [Prunus armeniaca]
MVLCIGFHLQRRKKFVLSAGDGRTNSPNELLNFMIHNRPTDDFVGLQNDHGNMGRHALSIFSFASVLAATCNFSEDNKLGERGFGPDYKGTTEKYYELPIQEKLATGREIAVKRLSKCSR